MDEGKFFAGFHLFLKNPAEKWLLEQRNSGHPRNKPKLVKKKNT
jgi:hypothetical protein